MKRFLFVCLMALALVPTRVFAQQPSATAYTAFSGAFAAPSLSGTGTTTLSWTAGTLYQGGKSVAITASTSGLSDTSLNNCAAPTYSSCEFVYWTSGTGLSKSSSYNTAFNAGNNIMVAYLTLDGSSNILTITPASLDLPPFSTPQPATNCSTSATCASPTTISGNLKWATGTVAFSSSTTANVSGLPAIFSSGTSFGVILVNANGHAYTSGVEVTSATAFTAVSGTSNSDTWTWIAIGYYLNPALEYGTAFASLAPDRSHRILHRDEAILDRRYDLQPF